MDHRNILLCDLAKGSIGDDNAKLLGSLIVLEEKLAALSRQDIAESERVPHVLYVEEAQSFIGDFESILAEARKFAPCSRWSRRASKLCHTRLRSASSPTAPQSSPSG